MPTPNQCQPNELTAALGANRNASAIEPLGVKPVIAAQIMGCGRTSIFEMIRRGELESVKYGRATVITMRSIRARMFGEAA